MGRPHWYFLFTIEEGNPDELVMKLIVEQLKNCDQRTITGDMGDGLGLLLDQVVPTRRTLGLEPATQPRAASSGTLTSCLGSHGRAPADVRDVCHDLDGLVEPAGAGGGARPAGGPRLVLSGFDRRRAPRPRDAATPAWPVHVHRLPSQPELRGRAMVVPRRPPAVPALEPKALLVHGG